MRVAIVAEMGEWSASTRFRAMQHEGRLRDLLGSVDVLLPSDRPARHPGRVNQVRYFADHAIRYVGRWQELSQVLGNYDAVLVQRGLYPMGPGAIARAIERFRGQVVYDLDDALFSPKPAMADRGAVAHWLYGPQQATRLIRRADAIVVSTPFLYDAVSRETASVWLLPTVPDPTSYRVAEHHHCAGTIGWAGTSGGLIYLELLRDIIKKIGEEGLGHLEVVSSTPWSGPSSFRQWRLEDENRLFARFAVGIMPLPDTPYTRGKAGFKLLQYMAAGVPVVASPIGVNRDLVERSGAGLLASSADEWDSALRTLLGHPQLRRAMGSRGREFVKQYADLNGQAELLADLLDPQKRGLRLSSALPG